MKTVKLPCGKHVKIEENPDGELDVWLDEHYTIETICFHCEYGGLISPSCGAAYDWLVKCHRELSSYLAQRP